ncbi:MAG: hypothetical protein AAF830_05210 [Pseudomonadota bacterium]
MTLASTYYRDRLHEVNEAIGHVQRGQSYEIANRKLERADIGELFRERRRLEPLAKQEAQMNSVGGVNTIRFRTSKGV